MTIINFALDISLAVGLVAIACASLTAVNAYRSVILFMTFGLLMAFTWARLNAPDVALVEVAIGSGLTGALLLSTANTLKSRDAKSSNNTNGSYK